MKGGFEAMHDDEYFRKMIKNTVMWALVAMLFIASALIVFAPLILAFRSSLWWLLLYPAYLAAFTLIALIVAGGGSDENC